MPRKATQSQSSNAAPAVDMDAIIAAATQAALAAVGASAAQDESEEPKTASAKAAKTVKVPDVFLKLEDGRRVHLTQATQSRGGTVTYRVPRIAVSLIPNDGGKERALFTAQPDVAAALLGMSDANVEKLLTTGLLAE